MSETLSHRGGSSGASCAKATPNANAQSAKTVRTAKRLDRVALLRLPVPRFAAFFFQKPHGSNGHAAIHRFAHVIDREQTYADSG